VFETYYSILFIILIIPLSFIISYFHYKNVELTKLKKYFLVLLRFLSLALILVLLLFPVIRLIEYIYKESKDIILIDNSLSLKLENRDSLLKVKVKDFVNILEDNNRDYDIFLFSGSLIKKISKDEVESINYDSIDNFKTNLDISLKEILDYEKDSKINTITIFSDGIINDGTNILGISGVNFKINYFLIGDRQQKPDLVLNELLYNKYSFISAYIPILVKFSSYNINKNVRINLYEEDKLVNYIYQNVTQDKIDYEVLFNIKSDIETIKRYNVDIEPDNMEITTKNNYRNFHIKFISNKFNILVLSGNPSPDFSFFKNQIQKIENIKADYLTQKDGVNFYEGNLNDFREYSCIVFWGFPTARTSQMILDKIKQEVEIYKTPLFFFAMGNVDYSKLKNFENYLPFIINSTESSEISIKLKPVIQVNKNNSFNFKYNFSGIENFPPLFYKPNLITSKPNSDILLSSSNELSPVFLVSYTEKNKSAAFLAYGLNNWRLNPVNYNYEPVFNSVLVNTISALFDYEKQKRIIVEPIKDEFSLYENVIINVRLNPLKNKDDKVGLHIYNPNIDLYPSLKGIGEHNFESRFKLENKGDYYSEAYLENIDTPETKDYFRFYINENNFEYIETRAREDYLIRLSNITGGKDLSNLDNNDINDLFSVNSKDRNEIEYLKNIYLNYNPIYIIILILLFSLEWFLRKKFNLP